MRIPISAGAYIRWHKRTGLCYIGASPNLNACIAGQRFEMGHFRWRNYRYDLYVCEDPNEALEKGQELLDIHFKSEWCTNLYPELKLSTERLPEPLNSKPPKYRANPRRGSPQPLPIWLKSPVIIQGTRYNTVLIAAEQLKVRYQTLLRRIRNGLAGYYFVDPTLKQE